MKKCVKCDTEKDVCEFSLRKSGNYNSWCKQCVRDKSKLRYAANKVDFIDRAKNKNILFRKHILAYLNTHPCVDCGETNPIVLQFDHRESETKKYVISNMKMMNLEKVDIEIAKCDVRCANCHLIRTAKQFNWYNF
jgi:hypothetical protein